jgi:hypothetical protein
LREEILTPEQVSVMLILPETKGISLERMDKLFGEIDYVAAREAEAGTELKESTAYNSARPDGDALEKSITERIVATETEKETKEK